MSEKVLTGDLETGTLVEFSGGLMVVSYNSTPLHLLWLSPNHPGHGYTAPQRVKPVRGYNKYDLVALDKGVIPSNDMGTVISAERLREILGGVDTSGDHNRAVSAHRNVHWCRTCGPCKCYEGRKVSL